MEVLTRTAVKEILLLFKASMCGIEDGPAAEQRVNLRDEPKRKSSKLTAGRMAGLKERKSVNGFSAYYAHKLAFFQY